MQIKDPEYWYRSAKANADTLSKILWSGFMLSVAAVGVHLGGKEEITVAAVTIPLYRGWIAFTAFTILHAIWAREFIKSARRYWELTDEQTYYKLFLEITSEGGYFMRNMTPRILASTGEPAPMKAELATWLSYVAALLLFFALLPASDHSPDRIIGVVAAILLTFTNWTIASHWAIALSELAVKKEYSAILAKRPPNARNVPTLFD